MPAKANRPIRVVGNEAFILLNDGREAVIDSDKAHLFEGLTFSAWDHRNTTYAQCRAKVDGRFMTLRVHRVVMGAKPGVTVDHIDGNGLNNRMENLRLATIRENVCNSRLSAANTSGFKGVVWDASRGKWQARVMVGRKNVYAKRFDDKNEAIQAVEAARSKLHGKFARSA